MDQTGPDAPDQAAAALLPPDAIDPGDRAGLRCWLEQNHEQSGSVWLVLWKAASGRRALTYDDLAEEALAFGWVDSLPRKLDAARSMIRLSPRKPGSAWSRVNKARAERLIAAGLMAPAGLAKIAQAMEDGTWSKLDKVEALEIPDDLSAALAAVPEAASNFAAFPRSSKRLILEWIEQARKPETRAKRIAETAELAGQGLRANHYRQPGGA